MKNNNAKPFYNTSIPGDWEVCKLGKYTTKIGSGSTPRGGESVYTKEGIPFIRSQNVNENQLILEQIRYIPESINKKMKGSIVQPFDILLNITGASLGRSCVVPKNFVEGNVNQHVCIIRTTKELCNSFLQFFISSDIGQIAIFKAQVGGNREGLNHSNVRSLKIPLPPLPEQRAIAHVLSLMDTAINKNMQLITQKELRKKWLMQNLLTGKKRLNLDSFDFYDDHDLSKNEKSSKSLNHKNHSSDNGQRLKGFGEEWKEKKLSNLFDRVTRKNTEGNTTVVTISAQRGFVRQTDFFKKNIASEITNNYFLVERGEFCYNKSYSNGYPWGATKRLNDFNKAVVTTLYICFGIKDKTKANGDYFEQFFEANYLDAGLTKIAHEGGRAHGLLNVTPSDFFSLKITTPSYEEQTAIAQVLQTADKEIEMLKTKTEKLREQKKGMMQVLLTGKKRLNCDSFDFSDDLDSDNQTENHISFKSHESHKSS